MKRSKPTQSALTYSQRAKIYAERVSDGTIAGCVWTVAACQRFLRDLDRADNSKFAVHPSQTAFPYVFDSTRADDACWFIERLPHIKGRWPSRTIVFEDWQCFVVCNIFGWINPLDGYRRFRTAELIVPRKNAKTTLAAGIGLYMETQDGEPGAEVYSAATTRDQAKITWEMAKSMVKRTTKLRERYGVEALAHSITVEDTGSFFKPLSRDADTLEGLNPHCAIVDELHAHKTREVFDVLNDAMGSRKQPLLLIISTEGDNAAGIMAEQVEYLQQVLSGRHVDENFFGIFYGLDKDDDWTDPLSWAKANPNLGVSVLFTEMEQRCNQAKQNAQSQASFLTKRLNVRRGSANAYFNMLAWKNRCEDRSLSLPDFYGKEAVAGLDLASKIDVAAKILLFRDTDRKRYTVFGKYYLPEAQLERGKPNYDIYRGWAESGLLTLTPGNIIDFDFIEEDLKWDAANFDVRFFAFDPYQATQLSTHMMAEGLPMVEVPANVRNYSEPMKEIEGAILDGRIEHNGDPILSWMIGNVHAQKDVKGNVYPRKAREENKIDGAVSMIMAMNRWMAMANVQSIYDREDRGMKSIG